MPLPKLAPLSPPMERVNNRPGDISQVLSGYPHYKVTELTCSKMSQNHANPVKYIIHTYYSQIHSIFVKPSIQYR